MGECKAAKILQDLKYEKFDIMATIVDMIKNIKLFASCFKNNN